LSRVFNFSAGPAALPEAVLNRVRDELREWGATGASVMEVSHRGKPFIACAQAAERDLRALLTIPDDYRVLFLQGGATQHFAQIPMNLASPSHSADYVLTGAWGKKAASYAKGLVNVRIAATTEADRFQCVPSAYDFDPAAAYVHVTPNETIGGVEMHALPDVGEVPIVADLSSSILSRPLDVRRYGLIYAGAQKNIGPSGLVILIARAELLERAPKSLSPIFSYKANADAESMLNTPPTFAWYVAGLVFQWLLEQGGLAAIGARNDEKARTLYGYIDGESFYRNSIPANARSTMNVVFQLRDAALDPIFVKEAEAAGLSALAGHRDVGGMRASIYNAMPLEGVLALKDFMADFVRRHG
jgi:phosphoserine aminotransferase